jgi:hypothetical protein
MTTTDDARPDARKQRPRVVGVAVVTLAAASAAIASFWLIAGPSELGASDRDDGQVMTYRSVETMAEHMGCSSSFRPATNPGTSSSAGECTYDGALVEFRIYPTEPQALAWLEGNRSQSLDARTGVYDSAGIYAGRWAVVIHSTDRDLIERAGVAVQR